MSFDTAIDFLKNYHDIDISVNDVMFRYNDFEYDGTFLKFNKNIIIFKENVKSIRYYVHTHAMSEWYTIYEKLAPREVD